MTNNTVVKLQQPEFIDDPLTDPLRNGARVLVLDHVILPHSKGQVKSATHK